MQFPVFLFGSLLRRQMIMLILVVYNFTRDYHFEPSILISV